MNKEQPIHGHVCVLSHAWLFVTPWSVAPKQEYWSGLLFPSPAVSQSRNGTWVSCVSCISRQIRYHKRHLGNPLYMERKKEHEVTQSCLTLCNPMDCSLPGSSLHGILQARILEWVAIPLSRGSSWSRDRSWVSRIAGRCFNLWATREALTSQRWDNKTMKKEVALLTSCLTATTHLGESLCCNF